MLVSNAAEVPAQGFPRGKWRAYPLSGRSTTPKEALKEPLPQVRAGEGNRTPDLLITSEPLCRLSYPGQDGAVYRAGPKLSGNRANPA